MTYEDKKNETKANEHDNNVIKKILESKKAKEEHSSHQESHKDDKLQKEVEELKKKLLYALADQENFKKSSIRDIENAKNFAISSFARDILISIENLEKTLAHIDHQQIESNQLLVSIFNGVKITLDDMLAALKRCGVEKIDAKGKKFDHNLHQAIKTVKDDNVEHNTVVDVLQDGYIIKGRLLRPAVVVVSSEEN